MAQFIRPIADIDLHGWTPSPGWSRIDEDIGGGGDDVVLTSAAVGNNQVTSPADLEGTNTGITDPAVSTGHILRVLWASSSTRDIIGHFEVWQGVPDVGTLIADHVFTLLDTTEQETSSVLTGTEADNITDYNDLHFALWGKGLGGGPARSLIVDACEMEIPDAAGGTIPVGTLAEVNTLITVVPMVIGTLAEVDSFLPVAADKDIITSVGTLAEVDALIPVAADNPIITAVGTLAEANALLAIAAEKIAAIGTLAELDALIAIAAEKPIITAVGTLAELEALLAIAAEKFAAIGTLPEIDSLIPVDPVKPIITAVGTLAEADSLLAIQARKIALIGTLAELDALIAIAAEKPIITAVGTLAEVDSFIPIQVVQAAPSGFALTLGKFVALEPSTVDLVVRWLKGNTAVSALLGTNVSSTLPVDDDDITYPWVTVRRLIGLPVLPVAGLDNARIQFIAHGGVTTSGAPNWKDCDLVIRTINQQIKQTLRVVVTGRGIIRSLSGLEGIQQLEDPDTGGAMFWMDAIIVTQGV